MKLIVLFCYTPLGIWTEGHCQNRITEAVLDSRNEDMFSLECHMYETGCTAKPSGCAVYILVWIFEDIVSSSSLHLQYICEVSALHLCSCSLHIMFRNAPEYEARYVLPSSSLRSLSKTPRIIVLTLHKSVTPLLPSHVHSQTNPRCCPQTPPSTLFPPCILLRSP